jgi:hypothetical protein
MDLIFLILGIVLVFFLGLSIGFWLSWWLRAHGDFDGVIFVKREQDKIVYSLELHGDPEELEFMDEVIFKVDTSE